MVWHYLQHYVIGWGVLAVGDLVDAGIVMVENTMKSLSGETD